MTATTSQNQRSPRGSGDAVISPQKGKNLPSPWVQVVRGEPESVPTVNHSLSSSPSSPSSGTVAPEQFSFTDCSLGKPASLPPLSADNSVATESSDGNNANAGRPKKAAWNKPSNGVAELSPVMGAVSWPALSESTKPSPKSSPAESSSKTVSDGSIPNSQGSVTPRSPQKQLTNNTNTNSTQNHTARQKSMRRSSSGGGVGGRGNNSGGGHLQSGFTHPAPPSPPPPPPPPFPVFAIPPAGYNNPVQALPDQSPREPLYRGNNWERRPVGGFVPPSPLVNDHRNSSRRGSFGPRGEGSSHNNLSGRRDQDSGRHKNSRDAQVQPQRASPRAFVRPSPNRATFVPPMAPYGNPMPFTDFVYIPTLPLDSFRGMPFIPHPPVPPPMIPFSEHPLSAMLVHQIEYYFSDANLFKDEFLKSKMDELGWVPITLIASFNRVKNMTDNIQLILDSLRTSTFLEVQDDKVRRRNDWMKWITSSNQHVASPGLQSTGDSSHDLATSFQKMAVDEMSDSQDGMAAKSSPRAENVQMS
uniref:Uncharacterized protein MANES_18G010500 n=2 Tax=Rhizophora mucronata TaxID=61149 RepID=A0A2P2M9N8_RHIMU